MAQQEQRKSYHVTKDFKGMNTKANRTAIDQNEFAWLENVMPIGYGNLRIVPTYGSTLATLGSVTEYMASGNIGNTNYLFFFQTDGRCQAMNLSTNALTTVGAAGTFSNAGCQIAQWKNERILIIDPTNGLFNWDGTNLVKMGSVNGVTITNGGSSYSGTLSVSISAPNQTGGVQATATATQSGGVITSVTITEAGSGYTSTPTISITGSVSGSGFTGTVSLLSLTGQAISTFSGRVWVAKDRTVYYSAVNSYNDFGTVSAGNITITDGTLHGNITQLLSANNFLYVFGTDSINVFSDVRVSSTSGSTLFTNTNVSASIGSDLPEGIFAYFRSVLFMNRYGVYALVGATTTKISDALDNVFPNIDFSYPVSACQALIYNILVAAWSVTYNDAGTLRKLQLVFFDRKWFITDMGAVTHIASSPMSGLINAYGARANGVVYKLFTNSTSNISSLIRTALWALNDPIRDKQALKFGVEATISESTDGTITITVDSENRTSPAIMLSNTVDWQNNNFETIIWSNNSSTIIGWSSFGYQLYKYDAQQYGKYLGLTISSTTPNFVLSGFQLEHELRARF
ncbi:MAG: hypothetical protein EBR82_32470 [Caulobacteraceae bacterium]|nr:hypothetical protein [Caulobacteraceae bacterium]